MEKVYTSAPIRNVENGIITVKVAEFDSTPDRVNDVYDPSAFDKTIDAFNKGENPIALLFSHDYNRPVGRINKFWKENNALYMEAKLNLDIPDGKLVQSMIEQDTIKNTSIGYTVVQDRYMNDSNKLVEVGLHEISFVAVPADPKAQIMDTKTAELSIKDASQALRSIGFTKRKTDHILQYGFSEANQKETQLKELATLFARRF